MDPIDKVLMENLDEFIVVLINGILVYPKSKEEHEGHLRLISQKL
jgi:hypothetical protein